MGGQVLMVKGKKDYGKLFESAIKKSGDEAFSIYIYRIKDSGSAFNPNQDSGLRFTSSNDYDFMVYEKPNFFPMELKSCGQTSISFQRKDKKKGKMIKWHQIEGLKKASLVDGVFAGLLMEFRKYGHTYWLNIEDFIRFMDTSTKGSINEKDVIEYGGVLMEQKLKRVNYSYNLPKLLLDIKEKYKWYHGKTESHK